LPHAKTLAKNTYKNDSKPSKPLPHTKPLAKNTYKNDSKPSKLLPHTKKISAPIKTTPKLSKTQYTNKLV
jgi:hypothetical protein